MNNNLHDQPNAPRSETLLSEFPSATPEQWRAAAEALLKGAPFEKKLITPTHEGIALQPIYGPESVAGLAFQSEFPGAGSRLRGERASGNLIGGWEISQELPLPTPAEFNEAALHGLKCGQTELNIPLDLATMAGRDPDGAAPGEVGACGLSLSNIQDMERAFDGIELGMISVYLRVGASALPASALFLALARKRNIELKELRGCIEVDPLGMLAWGGDLPVSLDLAYQEMASLTQFAIDKAPNLQTVAVQGHAYHNAGASATQELACVLATGIEYLRELQMRGIGINESSGRVRFALSAGSNFFMEVAKFRAARQVWAQAVRAMGGNEEAQKMHLHVRTSTFNKTLLDPHTNMLRTTTEAFSAVVGGCDGLHVGPFDEVIRPPDEFSRRIARNTQTILAEECDLNRVIDPAGGSWFVEKLTNEVAQGAWAIFQKIEGRGGMEKALAAGVPQGKITETASKRDAMLAKRRSILVGTNQFPNGREKTIDRRVPDYVGIQQRRAREVAEYRTKAEADADTDVLNKLAILLESRPGAALEAAVDAVLHGATIGEITRTLRANDHAHTKVAPLRIYRAAQSFERLRLAAQRYAEDNGTPPLLFQANMKPSRFYRGRADWTTGFFEVGGFKVLADTDFETIDEAISAAISSKAKIVVLTSTDETYAELAVFFAEALKKKQPGATLILAGSPGENEQAWREAGIDEFVNISSNALNLLTSLLKKIGVLR
jgi:methylmalonyl-CoA mutase